jgi:hypothetical protein
MTASGSSPDAPTATTGSSSGIDYHETPRETPYTGVVLIHGLDSSDATVCSNRLSTR